MKKKNVMLGFLIVIFIFIIAFGIKELMYMTCWIGDYKCRFDMPQKEAYIVGYRGNGDVVLPKKILFCDVIGYRDEVFKENDDVQTVYISNNPKKRVSTELYGCKNLTKVTYEEGTKVSYNYFFTDCENLDTVIFPNGMEYIYGSGAFAKTNIADVYIPKTVKYMDGVFRDTPFAEKHKEDKYYVAGDGVLVLYNGPQDEIVIPEGVQSIGDEVLSIFDRADNASIYVPESVKILSIILSEDDILYIGNGEYDLGNIDSYKGTFVAPAGSYMEQFCKDNNLNFRAMTEEEEATWREKTEAATSEIVYQD